MKVPAARQLRSELGTCGGVLHFENVREGHGLTARQEDNYVTVGGTYTDEE